MGCACPLCTLGLIHSVPYTWIVGLCRRFCSVLVTNVIEPVLVLCGHGRVFWWQAWQRHSVHVAVYLMLLMVVLYRKWIPTVQAEYHIGLNNGPESRQWHIFSDFRNVAYLNHLNTNENTPCYSCHFIPFPLHSNCGRAQNDMAAIVTNVIVERYDCLCVWHSGPS